MTAQTGNGLAGQAVTVKTSQRENGNALGLQDILGTITDLLHIFTVFVECTVKQAILWTEMSREPSRGDIT